MWGVGPEAIGGSETADFTTLWSGAVTNTANIVTLIRTRGWIHYFLTTSSAAGAGFQLASGIYLMTEDAFAAGSASALDPITDASSDLWIWHSFADVRTVTATIADGANAQSVSVRQEIDSKAMRKGFDSERVMVGVTQGIETGTCTAEFEAQTRQLFKT